jgi:two-component system, cell cycle sensor histidine kinase and response regulator CckA
MNDNHPPGPTPLRKKAECLLKQQEAPVTAVGDEQAIIHELQVHQIELQLQNEELRRSQAALEESRSRYSDLYHHAPVGYVVLNRAGIIVESNATFTGMLEAQSTTINGRAFADLLEDEDSGIFRARLRSFFKQPVEKHMELRLRLDHHRQLFIELSGVPLPDPHGSAASGDQLLITVTDISARKRLEMEQNALAAKLQQLDKEASLSRLAGAVAHNFNNMLAVILGNLELALEMLPQGELPLKELRDAQRAGMRAAETSALMLTYLGQNRAKKTRIDLVMICDQVLPPLLHAKPGEVTISCNHGPDKVEVMADGEQLRQVVNNLAANALEALQGKAGRIFLSLSRVTPAEIAGEYRFPLDWPAQGEEYACLTVGDDGCGIASEAVELIFEPFFTTKFPGRGMGLSVVLGILRAHDGCITVESRPGHGSVFRVYLPVA